LGLSCDHQAFVIMGLFLVAHSEHNTGQACFCRLVPLAEDPTHRQPQSDFTIPKFTLRLVYQGQAVEVGAEACRGSGFTGEKARVLRGLREKSQKPGFQTLCHHDWVTTRADTDHRSLQILPLQSGSLRVKMPGPGLLNQA
jgi:hypothetical protein